MIIGILKSKSESDLISGVCLSALWVVSDGLSKIHLSNFFDETIDLNKKREQFEIK